MSLPLSMILHLHIKASQKIALIAVFALALLVVALDTVRFVLVILNPTSMNNILVWNMVECAVVILVANAPSLRPLLFKNDFMRGGGIRAAGFFSRVGWRKHKRAQSTPWTSATSSGGGQYGNNRLSGKSVVTYSVSEEM
jgi:hypothetical protein